jgi:hypothetical protein
MLKKLSAFLPLLVLVACENSLKVSKESAVVAGVIAADVCEGKVIGGVTGTANCSASGSASVAEGLYVFSSRNDLASIDMTDPQVLLDLVNGSIDRSGGGATLSQVYSSNNFLNFFTARYQVIPNPVGDSDGRFNDNPDGLGKKHYLDRIVGRPDQECGTSGTISQRMTDCEAENGAKAFYNGAQYGAGGEGDWKLVSRLSTGEEVWRDERTKLVWSDKAMGNPNALVTDNSHPSRGGYYNWYQASGYAKAQATSQSETGYNSEPGSGLHCNSGITPVACQPPQPISVCAEVDGEGKIVGGGSDPLYTYQPNPETAFKGNLGITQNVLWKLPSRDDFMLAEVNGIRKVLRYMDDVDDSGYGDLGTIPHVSGPSFFFWSSTSFSSFNIAVWGFAGSNGDITTYVRNNVVLVRCVGFSRD